MNPRIEKLEALLSRIRGNAQAPRHAHAAPAAPSQSAEVQILEPETQKSIPTPPPAERAPEPEIPLESRARLVAAPHAELEELEAEEVLELDDRHVVREEEEELDADSSETAEVRVPAAALAASQTAKPQEPQEPEEAPPPSSRRPIAEPAESAQEAEIRVAPLHTPPPESGKQVAAEALSFDDDLTGVREASRAAVPPAEASIQLQSLRSPAVPAPAPRDEMEAELPGSAPEEATRPPPGPFPASGGAEPLPEMRAPRIESVPQAGFGPASGEPGPTQVSAEVTRPTRPVAAAQVAEMIGTVKPVAPKTFGDLLDLTLSL